MAGVISAASTSTYTTRRAGYTYTLADVPHVLSDARGAAAPPTTDPNDKGRLRRFGSSQWSGRLRSSPVPAAVGALIRFR